MRTVRILRPSRARRITSSESDNYENVVKSLQGQAARIYLRRLFGKGDKKAEEAMTMGFTADTGCPARQHLHRGCSAFFTPCVLPLLPLYLGYLSGGVSAREDGESSAKRRGRTFLNTLFL